jgi:hypothetical protein
MGNLRGLSRVATGCGGVLCDLGKAPQFAEAKKDRLSIGCQMRMAFNAPLHFTECGETLCSFLLVNPHGSFR